MTNEEKIAAIEAEIKTLKARVDDIFEALITESNSTTEQFQKVDRQFGKFDALLVEIVDYLMPVVHKVFPGIARGKREVEAFLKRRPPAPDAKKSG